MVRLNEIAVMQRGKVITKEQTINGNVPVIAGGKSPSYYHNSANREGNIITVSGSGAYAGYVNYWNMPVYCSDCFSIKSKDENKYSTKFLYYYLKAKQNYIYSKKKGAGIPHVKIESISDMPIPDISLNDQKNILGKIELINECINNRKSQLHDLDLYIESVFKEMFDSNYHNNFNFKKEKLGFLSEIERGASPRPIKDFLTNSEDGINWIKIGDTSDKSMYIDATIEKITKTGALKSRLVKKGNLILSNSMSFGRPYILNIDGCIHDGWLLIKNFETNFEKEFLCFLLGTKEIFNAFKNYAVGGVVNNLNSNLVRNIEVIVPPIGLQKDFCKQLIIINKLKKIVDDNIGDMETLIINTLNDYLNEIE